MTMMIHTAASEAQAAYIVAAMNLGSALRFHASGNIIFCNYPTDRKMPEDYEKAIYNKIGGLVTANGFIASGVQIWRYDDNLMPAVIRHYASCFGDEDFVVVAPLNEQIAFDTVIRGLDRSSSEEERMARVQQIDWHGLKYWLYTVCHA